MLLIAAEIDRLDERSDQQPLPSSAVRAALALLETAEGLHARAEQVSGRSTSEACPAFPKGRDTHPTLLTVT
jgi:hypothetical protein